MNSHFANFWHGMGVGLHNFVFRAAEEAALGSLLPALDAILSPDGITF